MILALLSQVTVLAPTLGIVLAGIFLAVRHQRLFLALFMLLTALDNTRDFAPNIVATLAGVSVYPQDVMTVICAGAALARIGQWRLRGVARTAALVLAGLVGLGVVSWILVFGVQEGTNSWRQEVLKVALLFYATTRPRAWSGTDLWVIIVWPAVVVALASVLGILLFGFGSNSASVQVNGVMEVARPVWAAGALLMLIGLWIAVLADGRGTLLRVLVISLLGAMVLLTQVRSVWVAAILGGLAWWLVPRIRQRERSSGLGGVSRTILIVIGAMAVGIVATSISTLGQSASNDATWQWRFARWVKSMSIPRSWLEWMAGSALGPTPVSTPGTFPTFAHSVYVDAIEKTGFIGLVALLCIVIAVGITHRPPWVGPLGSIVCVSFLGYGTAYQVPPWGWMLMGILLSSALVEPPRPAPPEVTRDALPGRTGQPEPVEPVVDGVWRRQPPADLVPG